MYHSFSFPSDKFHLICQAIEYEVGDILEVLPSQNPAAVDAFILRCNLDPESFITVSIFSCIWVEYLSGTTFQFLLN